MFAKSRLAELIGALTALVRLNSRLDSLHFTQCRYADVTLLLGLSMTSQMGTTVVENVYKKMAWDSQQPAKPPQLTCFNACAVMFEMLLAQHVAYTCPLAALNTQASPPTGTMLPCGALRNLVCGWVVAGRWRSINMSDNARARINQRPALRLRHAALASWRHMNKAQQQAVVMGFM